MSDPDRLRVEREAQYWRMVRDEFHKLDVRSNGPVATMADDDVIDIVIRFLRRVVKEPSEAQLRSRLHDLVAKWRSSANLTPGFLCADELAKALEGK
jgi:hypothetical protein